MKNQRKEVESRAVDAVLNVLPPMVQVDRNTSDRFVDPIVNGHDLEIMWIGDGHLADARRVLQNAPRHEHLVAVARHLSPGARKVLTEHGVSWVDETGAAEIVVGTIVVSRTGRPPQRAAHEARWTPAALATAEALLCGSTATVSGIQEATGLSTGACTRALKMLSHLSLLESNANRGPSSRRHVPDAQALLASYVSADKARRPPPELTLGVLWRDAIDGVEEIGQQWAAADIAWVVSGAVAGAVLAPLMTTVDTALVYVGTKTMAGLEAAARAADLRPIEGGRLTIRPFPTVTTRLLASWVGDMNVAPWPRVYADLQGVGVRGEEAAEHLREVIEHD